MKYVILTAFVLAVSVLQTTVLGVVEIFGVIPNLLVTAVICYSLIRGDFESVIFGAVCGFVLDLLSGRMVGMNMILCSVTAFMCACLHDNLFNNNSFVASVFVLWISALYELLIYIFYFLFWGDTSFVFAILHKILPCAAYNAAATFLVYPTLRGICLFDRQEND